MRNVVVAVHDLLPGDVLVRAGLVVEAVHRRGPLRIVDFTNGTTTSAIPARSRVTIRRRRAAPAAS